MRFIAHRGNINGPNPDLENNPRYIIQAIEKGFDVEIDVWKTDALYLGHDGPDHKIELKFLLNHKDHLWCNLRSFIVHLLVYFVNHFIFSIWLGLFLQHVMQALTVINTVFFKFKKIKVSIFMHFAISR